MARKVSCESPGWPLMAMTWNNSFEMVVEMQIWITKGSVNGEDTKYARLRRVTTRKLLMKLSR